MAENTSPADEQKIIGFCDGLRKSKTTKEDAEAMLEVNTIAGYRNIYGEAAKRYLDELDNGIDVSDELEVTDPGINMRSGFVILDESALEEVDKDLTVIPAEALAPDDTEDPYTVIYDDDEE